MIKLLVVLTIALIAAPASAQSTTPEPLPLPTQQMYEQMATAAAQLDDTPADLTAPDGMPILPDPDVSPMFGYIKWLVSPAAADEWAGPFAPVFQHIGIGLGVLFGLAGVYATMYVIANIGSWIGWLIESARKTLDLLMQFLQAGPMLLVLVVIIFVAFLLFTQEGVMSWLDEQLDNVIDWVFGIVDQLTGGA